LDSMIGESNLTGLVHVMYARRNGAFHSNANRSVHMRKYCPGLVVEEESGVK